MITPDDSKKIKEVIFANSYIKSDSINSKKLAKEEFKKIKNYLDSLFQDLGKTFVPEHGENDTNKYKGVLWTKKNIKYTLIASKLKRNNQKMTNGVMFSYSIIN